MLVAGNNLATKAGLLPIIRGLTGSIVHEDVIVAIDGKPVRIAFIEILKLLEDEFGDKKAYPSRSLNPRC